MALPFLEIMRPARASAQAATPQRFFGFFYPCGTDPSKWDPAAGALTKDNLTECLVDMAGFAAEGIWPAGDAIVGDVTVVTGIDHSGVSTDIHIPSNAFNAFKPTANNYTPPEPTLDQYLADSLRGETAYRNLALSATTSTDIAQGNISFKAGGQVETVVRKPDQLFNTLFGMGNVGTGGGDMAAEAAAKRQQSVLDLVLADAQRLNGKLGAADKQRLDQYLTSVSELEGQIKAMPSVGCTAPGQPATGGNWHSKAKLFIDLAVTAMACDLTRVVTLQYSDSWGVNYSDYSIGEGKEALGDWSDHFISHKLDDNDRATDLDGLDRTEAMNIANARVVSTSRFKVRRFAYLVNALKSVATANGTLLDEALVLYASENGDGDSHARTRMPTLIAGHAGGFETGRAVSADKKTTGALHASLISRYGLEVSSYGSPAGTPIAGL